MIEQAKKMRSQWLTQNPASQSQTRDRSRGWHKYNRSELPKNKEELNSLVESRVKKAVSKAMHSAGKRKPREAEETDYENELSFKHLKVSDSDSDSEWIKNNLINTYDNYALVHVRRPPKKKIQKNHLSPIVMGDINCTRLQVYREVKTIEV